MAHVFRTVSPELWMQQIFDVKSARQGGVVRRKLRDVERNIGLARLQNELQRRGYHAVLNGEQVVIFCNNQAVRLLC
ncbi:N-(5'-phosphoribosyl)anthranilate isomerase [Leisingera thetidis]|uniref:N-(5'-phosphoribosyl)anthranilate isomerase n=1 Tax=Leisingera thetidis TaxID=2930199 RepID=UPI0021F76F97|nr:N-(5'-phosphoribosyl)anthranilate isomerase [Leisingera thetidis]